MEATISDNNPSKRSRPDRALKLQQRKTFKETVVKCSFGSVLVGSNEQKHDIVQAVDNRVISYSKRAVLATRTCNLLAKQAYQDVQTAASSPFACWDTTFIRQLLLGTQGCTVIDPCVPQVFADHPELLHDTNDRHILDRNVYSAAATKISTNIKNHLRVNVVKIVKRMVYTCSPSSLPDDATKDEKGDERTHTLFQVCGWSQRVNLKEPKKPNKKRKPDTTTTTVQPPRDDRERTAFIDECRRILGLRHGVSLDDGWISEDDNLPGILRFFAHVLRTLEQYPDQKLFNLLPICKRKRHFITIDTYSLYGIARDANLVKKDCNLATFVANKTDQWGSIINFAKLMPKGGEFTGTIETDGVSVCIHYKRPRPLGDDGLPITTPKKKNKKKKSTPLPRPTYPIDLQETRVLSIDPGRVNIIFAAEVLPDNKVKTYRLTRSHYYKESGITKGNANSLMWQRGLKNQLVALSETSPKGISLLAFLNFLAVDLSVATAMWEELLKKRWSQQRLRLYGGKKRVINKFFTRMRGNDKRRTIVAYGAAKLKPGGKGEISVPTSGVYKTCKEKFETYLVDEFRTTRVHHEDDTILRGVGRKKGDNEIEEVRGLLWCSSTRQGNSKFVNRDLNGALNIRRCLLLQERPAIMDRSRCRGQRLTKTIGKIIPF
jgi:hypothetical protein